MKNNIIAVKVTTKSSKEKIKVENLSDGTQLYRVYVTSAPENNKANDDVISLLAEHFSIAKSNIKIVSGVKNRNKKVHISFHIVHLLLVVVTILIKLRYFINIIY